jgi:hypothetical protein
MQSQFIVFRMVRYMSGSCAQRTLLEQKGANLQPLQQNLILSSFGDKGCSRLFRVNTELNGI